MLDGPVDALPVFFGDRGDIDGSVGEVDSLGALEDPAGGAVAAQFARGFVGADEAEHAIFDEQRHA